ncbi:MAG: amidohydrolase [Clostridia bacterium]|nr:amidohydrolase [Clostridia bacterium]
MNSIKKIDIHSHIFLHKKYTPPSSFSSCHTALSPTELIEFYDRINIEKGVLLPSVSPEWMFALSTSEDAKEATELYPDRFLWFCSLDPRGAGNSPDADWSKVIGFYKELGAKGVGELYAQLPFDDPLMDNLFYHCAECDMPVTIHIAPTDTVYGYYGIMDDAGLPRLEKMLKKHEKLKILGHSQLFWAEISDNGQSDVRVDFPTGRIEKEGRLASLMREYPNLYCDVSANSGANAFMRDPDYAARFVEEFSDRILYGTDYGNPYSRFPFEFDAWLERFREDRMISEDNYYKFVRGNAEKLLGL